MSVFFLLHFLSDFIYISFSAVHFWLLFAGSFIFCIVHYCILDLAGQDHNRLRVHDIYTTSRTIPRLLDINHKTIRSPIALIELRETLVPQSKMLTKTLILTPTYPANASPPHANGPQQRFRRQVTTILHATSLTASLIALSLFAAAIPQWNLNFFHSTGPSRGDWTDGMPLGPLTVALLYHAVVLVHPYLPSLPSLHKMKTQTLGPKRSQLVHAVVSTLLLLSLFPALFLAGYGSLFRFWRPAMRASSGVIPCTMLNVFARECEPVLYHVGTLQIGGIIFGSFVWTSHFALLLVALRNLRRHKLIKQIQSEKLSQFSSRSESMSRSESRHSSRRGLGSRKGSLRSVENHEEVQPVSQLNGQRWPGRSGSGSSRSTTSRKSSRSEEREKRTGVTSPSKPEASYSTQTSRLA